MQLKSIAFGGREEKYQFFLWFESSYILCLHILWKLLFTMRKRQREGGNYEAESPSYFSNGSRDYRWSMPNLPKRWNKSSLIRFLILKSLDNSFILFIFAFITDLLFYFKISCLGLLIYKENSTNCYFSIYLFGWETLVMYLCRQIKIFSSNKYK